MTREVHGGSLGVGAGCHPSEMLRDSCWAWQPSPPFPRGAPGTVAPHTQLPWSSLPRGHCFGSGCLAQGDRRKYQGWRACWSSGSRGLWGVGLVPSTCRPPGCKVWPPWASLHATTTARARVTSSPMSHSDSQSALGPVSGPSVRQDPPPTPTSAKLHPQCKRGP